jgi:hypothetical protein
MKRSFSIITLQILSLIEETCTEGSEERKNVNIYFIIHHGAYRFMHFLVAKQRSCYRTFMHHKTESARLIP